jgi:hypothetical protein
MYMYYWGQNDTEKYVMVQEEEDKWFGNAKVWKRFW